MKIALPILTKLLLFSLITKPDAFDPLLEHVQNAGTFSATYNEAATTNRQLNYSVT